MNVPNVVVVSFANTLCLERAKVIISTWKRHDNRSKSRSGQRAVTANVRTAKQS